MKSRLIKLMSVLIVGCSLFSISASAEWRQNSKGWWYTEGNSYATGWKLIDGNWYYFYSDGYMASDTLIDGYYLNNKGAWTETTISLDEAKSIASSLIGNKYFENMAIAYNPYDNYLSKDQNKIYYAFWYGSSDGQGNMIDAADSNICINKYNGEIYIGCPARYNGGPAEMYSLKDFYKMLDNL